MTNLSISTHHFDLTNQDPQRIENIANELIKALSPFYQGAPPGGEPFEVVASKNIEAATAMMILSVSTFRDMGISDSETYTLMAQICRFALSGATTRFVRVT